MTTIEPLSQSRWGKKEWHLFIIDPTMSMTTDILVGSKLKSLINKNINSFDARMDLPSDRRARVSDDDPHHELIAVWLVFWSIPITIINPISRPSPSTSWAHLSSDSRPQSPTYVCRFKALGQPSSSSPSHSASDHPPSIVSRFILVSKYLKTSVRI